MTYNGNATAAAEVKFTVKPLPVSTYPVTNNGGKGSGSYSVGEKVTITAIVPEGRHFTSYTDAAAPDTFMISNTRPLTPDTDGNVMISDEELSAAIENAKQNVYRKIKH